MNKQLLIPVLIFFGLSLTLSSCGQQETTEQTEQTQENLVNPENFIRAETDNMFAAMVNAAGGTNKFFHFDKLTPLDRQTVIRMNRDVLYSGGVFDAKEGLEIIFPELPDERYASVFILDNDHYMQELYYEPGTYKVEGNTPFLYMIIRIQLMDPSDADEIAMINELQRKFVVSTGSNDEFPGFSWDRSSLDSLRNIYNEEAKKLENFSGLMGRRGEVNEELRHLAASAGWGLLPDEAATYLNYSPGVPSDQCYSATYMVPENDAFWSITVYGSDGYIKTENCIINQTNAEFNDDGSFTVHFGTKEQCGDVPNRLDAPEGWNIALRVYKPGDTVLEGTYSIPEVQPVK